MGKLTAADTTDVVSSMHTRKFLLDSVTQQPIGVIKSVIFVKEHILRTELFPVIKSRDFF